MIFCYDVHGIAIAISIRMTRNTEATMANQIEITDVRPSTTIDCDRALDCTATINGMTGTVTFVPMRSGQGYEPAGDSPDCWIEDDLYQRLDDLFFGPLADAAAEACDRYVW